MRLAKIKNRYMYKTNTKDGVGGDDPNGTHPYAIFWDRKDKEWKAIQINHVWIKDPKRVEMIKKQKLLELKIPGLNHPTQAVSATFYRKDANGHKLQLSKYNPNVTYISKKHFPKRVSDSIKFFSRYPYK